MSFIEQNLSKGEEIVLKGTVTPTIFIGPGILAAVIFLVVVNATFFGALILGLLILTPSLVRYFTTEFAITNKRVLGKIGLIRRTVVDNNIRKTEAITFEQGILGRILNYGTVVISAAGSKNGIAAISDPNAIRTKFNEVQEAAEKEFMADQIRAVGSTVNAQ